MEFEKETGIYKKDDGTGSFNAYIVFVDTNLNRDLTMDATYDGNSHKLEINLYEGHDKTHPILSNGMIRERYKETYDTLFDTVFDNIIHSEFTYDKELIVK